MKFRIGDTAVLHDNDANFNVRINNIFEYEGEEYAEVSPIEFARFSREVKAKKLTKLISDEKS